MLIASHLLAKKMLRFCVENDDEMKFAVVCMLETCWMPLHICISCSTNCSCNADWEQDDGDQGMAVVVARCALCNRFPFVVIFALREPTKLFFAAQTSAHVGHSQQQHGRCSIKGWKHATCFDEVSIIFFFFACVGPAVYVRV